MVKELSVGSTSIFTRFKLQPRLFRFTKIKIGAEKWPLCFDRRHSEICNREIKSVPNFWLRENYEMPRGLHQRVYSSARRLFRINITYLNFCIFFTVFAALSQNLPDTPCIFTLVHFHLVVSRSLEGFQMLFHHQLSCDWCLKLIFKTSLQQNVINHELSSNHCACLRIKVSNWSGNLANRWVYSGLFMLWWYLIKVEKCYSNLMKFWTKVNFGDFGKLKNY